MLVNFADELVLAFEDPRVGEALARHLRPVVVGAMAEQQATDPLLTSAQAAALLGYPSPAAFKMARGRDAELGALGVKVGRLWRYRRSDLVNWLGTHERARRTP